MGKKLTWTVALCCTLGISLAACVPQAQDERDARMDTTQSEQVMSKSVVADANSLADLKEAMAQRSEIFAPRTVTLEDGTLVQRTPDDAPESLFDDAVHSFNTYYLDADNRGCTSCHEEGLYQVISGVVGHNPSTSNLGSDMTPMDCRMCHADNLKALVHGIHEKQSFTGDCMTCHSAGDDGLVLWEESKYDELSGITPVENPQAKFTYEQDTISEMFNWQWLYGACLENYDNYLKDAPRTDEAYDAWEFTVDGKVDRPFTMTLSELLEEAPIETFVGKLDCVDNWPGGPLIANVEMKGIPFSWLAEKAGVQPGEWAAQVRDSAGRPSKTIPLDDALEKGWLVFEINGQKLGWLEGFPVCACFPSYGANMAWKYIHSFEIVDGENSERGPAGTGHVDAEGAFENKPEVGITELHEGQVLPVGQPHDFTGYAAAFDEQVVSVEVSLDRGATWQKLDTSDSDQSKWVYWHFEWTPEEPGAYVMTVRATSESGLVSPMPDVVMFNAKAAA